MSEFLDETPAEVSAPSEPLPGTAYIGAVFSFLFVTVGCVGAYFMSFCVIGDVFVRLPQWVVVLSFWGILVMAPMLGGLSAWQALKKSRSKLERRRQQE